MNIVVQFTNDEEAKALPILLRHSPGAVLAGRTYIVESSVVQALTKAGVRFQEITPSLALPIVEDLQIGERI